MERPENAGESLRPHERSSHHRRPDFMHLTISMIEMDEERFDKILSKQYSNKLAWSRTMNEYLSILHVQNRKYSGNTGRN